MARTASPQTGLTRSENEDGVLFWAEGDWSVENAAALEPAIAGAVATAPKAAIIDLSTLRNFDTAGAWLIDRLARDLSAGGAKVAWTGISDTAARLLKTVRGEPRAELPPVPARNPARAGVEAVGRAVHGLWRDVEAVLSMLGGATRALIAGIANRRLRFTSIIFHLEHVGLRAIPIILMIAFLIGAIIAQQAAFYFREFGAEIYVVDLVGFLVFREMGVLLTVIMVAARSGSAFTSEIGSMKMREEIDALRVIGARPTEVLVLPRLIALVIAVPLLTFLADMAAVFGGALICSVFLDLPFDSFIARMRDAVALSAFWIGILKAPFMALIIGLIAASEGLKVRGSAESLGRHTTSSVVKSILMVIVADGVFAAFFATIGY